MTWTMTLKHCPNSTHALEFLGINVCYKRVEHIYIENDYLGT